MRPGRWQTVARRHKDSRYRQAGSEMTEHNPDGIFFQRWSRKKLKEA
jgi:hypothetical protein